MSTEGRTVGELEELCDSRLVRISELSSVLKFCANMIRREGKNGPLDVNLLDMIEGVLDE